MAEQVRSLVQRKDFPKSAGDDAKVRFVFRNVLQRDPSAGEMTAAMEFLNAAPEALVETNALVEPTGTGAAARSSEGGGGSPRLLTPFERYTQVVLLTNEFMYVR
jgi:hypothetical protein